MHVLLRRTAAVLAVPALSLTALTAISSPAHAATDEGPASDAGTWLVGKLQATGWIAHNQQYDFDDYGLTIDAGLALDTVGAPASVVESISDAVAGHIDDYVAPGYGTKLSAGGTAKALVLAQAAGDDPASYGGRDLLTDLEGRVSADGANAGRIQDDWDPSVQYAADFANVLGQAFAAQGLDAAGSAKTDAVTDFLLAQQCSAGYFRQDFAAVAAADQSCDGGGGKPSVDATALAIQALQGQLDDTGVAAHVADAAAWLVAHQKANGGFGSTADISTVNANSTGGAASALLVSGESDAAAKAAAWLRAHQATNVANCVYYDAADTGAVLYDNAARRAAQGGPMDAALSDQSLRATTQALTGLVAAQAGPGSPYVLYAPGYVKAGGTTAIGVNDAAPGEALCAMLGEQSVLGWADPLGEGLLKVRVPAKAGRSTVTVADAGGEIGDARIHALGAKTLRIALRSKRVAAGHRQVVTVRRLAPGELARVTIEWPSGSQGGSGEATAGQADANGVLRVAFRAPRRHVGAATVKARGQFKNRNGHTSFTVTR